jgi:hypothetical protein
MFFKRFFTFLVALALFFGLQQLIELRTYGFCLQKIFADDIPYNEAWETASPNADILERLGQPYFFLGAGSECFAFRSADGKNVIKFFKLDVMRPVYLLRGLFLENYSSSLSPLQRILSMRTFRIQRTFDSLSLSYEHLKEETGLLYLHLNPRGEVNKTITLYDPCGIAHMVDLRTTRFFLQESATPLRTHLLDLKKKGQWNEACHCIDSVCALIMQRAQKGFSDRDPRIKNFGFTAGRALEIDAGSFTPCPTHWPQELFFATIELHEWAAAYYPPLADYLSHHLEILLCTN